MCVECVKKMQEIENLIDTAWITTQMQKETLDDEYRKMRDARRAEMRTIIDGCKDYSGR